MNNLNNENIHAYLEALKEKQLALQEQSKKIKENIGKISVYLQTLIKAFSEINNDITYINKELEKNAEFITQLEDICVQAPTHSADLDNKRTILKDDSIPNHETESSFGRSIIKECANLFSTKKPSSISKTGIDLLQSQNIPSIEKPIILREITEYNKSYSAYKRFENSCSKHGVSIYYYTNLYTLLLSLKRKKLNIVLERDGYEQFCPSEGTYQGSEEWAEKWNKIVFSPDITPKDFLHSLDYIFKEHGLETIKHPNHKTLVNFNEWELNSQLEHNERETNELIKNHNSYIFIGLYLMHYTMTISNNETDTQCIVTNFYDIERRNQISIDEFQTKETNNTKMELRECCQIYLPSRTDDSDITENEKDLNIVFTEDIISNSPSLKYRTSSYLEEEKLIVCNDIVLSKTDITAISLWHSNPCHASDETIVLKGINNNLSQEFLFLYLRTMFNHFKSQGYNSLNQYNLSHLTISIPPKNVQKQIIKDFRNNPTMDLVDLFKEIYPHDFELLLKDVENLLSKGTNNNQTTPISTYSPYSFGLEYVKGHYRKGGIFVRGHYRRK